MVDVTRNSKEWIQMHGLWKGDGRHSSKKNEHSQVKHGPIGHDSLINFWYLLALKKCSRIYARWCNSICVRVSSTYDCTESCSDNAITTLIKLSNRQKEKQWLNECHGQMGSAKEICRKGVPRCRLTVQKVDVTSTMPPVLIDWNRACFVELLPQ
jgi:hypothetical protein